MKRCQWQWGIYEQSGSCLLPQGVTDGARSCAELTGELEQMSGGGGREREDGGMMNWEGSAERRRDWLDGEERSNDSAFDDHQRCRASCPLHRPHRPRQRPRSQVRPPSGRSVPLPFLPLLTVPNALPQTHTPTPVLSQASIPVPSTPRTLHPFRRLHSPEALRFPSVHT